MSSIVKRFKEIYCDSTSSSSLDSSSEDELKEFLVKEAVRKKLEKKKGSTLLDGSIQRRLSIHRNHQEGHQRLFNDYFTESPVYSENIFRRRFRMRRNLFLRIQSAVETHESYFQQRRNAAKKLGLSSLQKITASLRMLAYGVTGDFVDEYVRLGESTTNKSLKMFVKTIISVFGDEYLRSPNSDDIARLLAIGEMRDFPEMLSSIDCMH